MYGWPIHHFVYLRQRKTELEHRLAYNGFRLVFCAESNAKLIKAQERIQRNTPWLSTQRYISKAQNLHTRLLEINIDFQVSYYQSASPYGIGGLDEPSTLRNLRAALDAEGLQRVDHEVLFEQEFTEFKSDPMFGMDTDVLMFTNAKFLSMFSAKRRAWWNLLGYKIGEKPGENIKGEPVMKPVGFGKIAVIFNEPPIREFDTERLVHPENVAELQASPSNHHIVEIDGQHFETRPVDMEFGRGAQRGYPGRSDAPKIIVSTTNPVIADEAQQCIQRRAYCVTFSKSPTIDTTLLHLFGIEPELPF